MKKELSAIFMLAGTAIGSGMISLPIVLSYFWAVPSLVLIILCGIMTYISAIVRTELNLHSDPRFTLEKVGLIFSGKTAAMIGNICLKLLSFSLLSAYIYGLSMLISDGSIYIKLIIAAIIFAVLSFHSNKIILINKKLFSTLLIIMLVLILCLVININLSDVFNISNKIQLDKFSIILPTLFTSFGFQGSLHSLTKFCDNDKKMIKCACLWGCLIPAIVYICWTLGAMFVIFKAHPDLFMKMSTRGVDIDEFISGLCSSFNGRFIKISIFMVSLLAIMTSIIGCGIALVDDIKVTISSYDFSTKIFKNYINKYERYICSAIAVVPAACVAMIIPSAFIKVLGFAGMILSILAIFLPSYLLFKIKEKLQFKLLENKFTIFILIFFGLVILICESKNMFF